MTQEEIKELIRQEIKDHLVIYSETNRGIGETEVKITIMYGGEKIMTDEFYIPAYSSSSYNH